MTTAKNDEGDSALFVLRRALEDLNANLPAALLEECYDIERTYRFDSAELRLSLLSHAVAKHIPDGA